jgi:GT2 family glycosyltransferase
VFLLPGARITHLVGQTRRRFIGLTEFHRLRSHRRFFLADSVGLRAGVISLLFSFYLALQQAARLIGITEFEYSWARRT